jgi:hypothetical protein
MPRYIFEQACEAEENGTPFVIEDAVASTTLDNAAISFMEDYYEKDYGNDDNGAPIISRFPYYVLVISLQHKDFEEFTKEDYKKAFEETQKQLIIKRESVINRETIISDIRAFLLSPKKKTAPIYKGDLTKYIYVIKKLDKSQMDIQIDDLYDAICAEIVIDIAKGYVDDVEDYLKCLEDKSRKDEFIEMLTTTIENIPMSVIKGVFDLDEYESLDYDYEDMAEEYYDDIYDSFFARYNIEAFESSTNEECFNSYLQAKAKFEKLKMECPQMVLFEAKVETGESSSKISYTPMEVYNFIDEYRKEKNI